MSINALGFEFKSYALGYAAKGFPVFPCRLDKSPYTLHGFKDATTDIKTIMDWWEQWPDASIGIATANYTVLDVDPKNGGDKTLAELEKKYGALPMTPKAKTGSGGFHHWFLGNAKCKADKKTGLDIRSDGGYVIVPPSLHLSGNHYEWIHDLNTPMVETPAWLLEAFGTKQKSVAQVSKADPFSFTWGGAACDLASHEGTGEGERNATLCRLVGVHIDRGDSKASVLAMAKAWSKRCTPPYPDADVIKTVEGIYTKAEAKGEYKLALDDDNASPPPAPILSDDCDTPTVPILDAAAYHGVLGDYVRLIEPHTEADPAAILLTSLAAFGNACGAGPCFTVEADRHHANIFVVCVGESGHGRKGVSLGRALALFRDDYRQNNITQGLSSGEGLIFAVRDETKKYNAKDGLFEVLDPGVKDKRLLVTETEFAQALKVLRREGNTLSPLLRQAFDGGVLRAMTKTQTKATDPHVSIVAHVTRQELGKCLGESEYFNGFANRFLWAITKRSKLLPDGGKSVNIEPLRQRVDQALLNAKAITSMKRSPDAAELWRGLYAELNEDRPGLFGACASRAAAVTLRLSMIYALTDGTDTIEVRHLQAAHAVWCYCEASARLIFGDEEKADALTSEVYRLVSERPGMTKTDLINAFNRNVPAKDITKALVNLHAKGKLVCVMDKAGPGRPAERWYLAGQSPTPPPPADDDHSHDQAERINELTNKVPAHAQAVRTNELTNKVPVSAGPGDSSFIRSFVDQAGADGSTGKTDPFAVLSYDADDDDFLIELERTNPMLKPLPVPFRTPLVTPWGITASLMDVYDEFAKTPVDIVNGVIMTPITKVYRLVMDAEAKERCPDLAGRLRVLANGTALLDVTEAELALCTKA